MDAPVDSPDQGMAQSEAPAAKTPKPWSRIAAVLLAVLIVVAAAGAYFAASRPPPVEVSVSCPTGYTFDRPTSTCVKSDTTKPTAVASQGADTVRLGDEVTFDASASVDDVGVSTWVWDFGDGTMGYGQRTRKAYGAPGQYLVTVTATDAVGNSDTNEENLLRVRVLHPSVTASNNSAPVVTIAVDRDVIQQGGSVFFDGKSSWIWRWDTTGAKLREVCTDCTGFTKDSTAMTYRWDFGDASSATTVNSTHKFDKPGTYGVSLLATGYNGLASRTYRTIHVFPTSPPQAVKNPNTIVRATFGEVAHLDPARAYDSASGEVLDQVYEKLLFYDRDSLTVFKGVLATDVPSAAAGTISADGREYRFHIRQNVKFHNGQALTASDVEYSIERNIISDFSGGPMWLLMEVAIAPGEGVFNVSDPMHRQRVQDFVRVEGNDVVFTLSFAFPPFLALLASWGSWVVDEETVRAGGGWPQAYDEATLAQYNDNDAYRLEDVSEVVGTGPYKLDSWDFGVQVVMKKNPDYWNKAANPRAVDTVILRKVVEQGTLLLLLQNGDADFASVLTTQKPQVTPLVQAGDVRLIEGIPTLSLVFTGFNFDIDPTSPYAGTAGVQAPDVLSEQGIPSNFFTDVNVRKGFAYCMDYSRLITETLRGNAQQARGPIPEGLQGYSDTSPVYTRDETKAREAFQAAFDGALWTTGFTFELLYNEGNVIRQTAATMMSDCVKSLNTKFHTSIRGIPWATYLGGLANPPSKWTMGTIGWGADYADAHNFAQPFLDGRAGAFAHPLSYNSAAVNALIDQGVTQTDPAQREQTYRQLQQKSYEDVSGIFLYQANTFFVYRSWITGWYRSEILAESTYYFDYTKG